MPIEPAMQQSASQDILYPLALPEQGNSEGPVEWSPPQSTSGFVERVRGPNSTTNSSSISDLSPDSELSGCLPDITAQLPTQLVIAPLSTLVKSNPRIRKRRNDERKMCPICGKRTRAVRDTNRHILVHHQWIADWLGIPSYMGSCPECGIRERKDNINRHFREKHKGKIEWRGDVAHVVERDE
jgi:hypothetical protein